MATDHARGHPVATKASFITGIPKIHHNACGGRIRHQMFRDKWECDVCNLGWRDEVVNAWGDAEIEIRFHLRGDIDPESFAIVWVTEGKHRFTRLVPVAEADRYERFVL